MEDTSIRSVVEHLHMQLWRWAAVDGQTIGVLILADRLAASFFSGSRVNLGRLVETFHSARYLRFALRVSRDVAALSRVCPLL
jgi:hypothetical protein